MSNENLMDILRGIWTPIPNRSGAVVQSDAPGTSDRDIEREGSSQDRDEPLHSQVPKVPDPWRRHRAEGPGPAGTLGYRNRGDDVRVATRLNEQRNASRARFPELATHGTPFVPPQFNILYDIFKTEEAYDKCVLFTTHGSFTVNSSQQSIPLTMDPASTVVGASQSPLSHLQLLGQFPGALQMFPVLLTVSFGQTLLTGTGEFSLTFVPQGGDVAYPIGEFNAAKGDYQDDRRHLIKAPITDPGQTTLGNLIFTPNSIGGTPGVLFFRIGFGIALLLPAPAFKTPENLQVGQWITASPEPPLQRLPGGELLAPETKAKGY